MIGIHKGYGINKENINYGTLLKCPISEFYWNIEIKNEKINEIIE